MGSIWSLSQRPCLDSKCSILSSGRDSSGVHTLHSSTSPLEISIVLPFPFWDTFDRNSPLRSGKLYVPEFSIQKAVGRNYIPFLTEEKTFSFFSSLFQKKCSKTIGNWYYMFQKDRDLILSLNILLMKT